MPNEFKVKNGLLVSGSANINASGSEVFSVDGTSGRLFQVDDTLSGSLFSVNTAAGLPIIEAFSNNTVRIGQFGSTVFFVSQSRVGLGKEANLNSILDVSGILTVTGSVNVLGSITSSANIRVNTLTVGTGNNSTTSNTAVGLNALARSTTANRNTAIGNNAMSASTTAANNTALGTNAMINSIGASSNVAVGENVLFSNVGGNFNVALGVSALGSNTDGADNTAIGFYAGDALGDGVTANTTSDFSVYIGSSTKASQSNGQNEIVIGYNTTGNGSNSVTLGNTSITNTYLRGVVSASSYQGSGASLTGIVTQIVAGANVTISPVGGTGAVTINAASGGGGTSGSSGTSGTSGAAGANGTAGSSGSSGTSGTSGAAGANGTAGSSGSAGTSGAAGINGTSGTSAGGGGTPGGVNTTIQFNDAGAFSGSGNFTFTKATNTVRVQASGSALFIISGSRGELLRVQDSGSTPNTLATISSGSSNVFTFTTSSLLVTGSVNANIETDALHYGRIIVTPSTNQNDYAPTGWNDANPAKATTININNGASIKITGLAGGQAGRLAILKNSSTDRLIILEDESASSTAANRFDFRNPIFLIPNASITLLYDGVDSRWQPIATSGGIGFGAFFDTYDDFIGAVSTFTTTATEVGRFAGIGAGTGASGQASTYLINTTEKPLGVYQIDTGTTTTGRAILGSTDAASVIPANGQAVFLCRIAVEALSTAGDEYQIFAGFQDSVGTTTVTDGVFWEYRRASSTAWQGATANNTTTTRTGAAGPTVDTNYIWLGIYVNSTWSRATYFYSQDSITWVISGEITTNLPTAARSTGLGITINKTAGTTQRNCSIDLMAYRYDITRG